jgi:hypothetical protein
MRKYSITYKLTSDPTKVEQESLINELTAKNITILDEIPGVISVSGNEKMIKEVLGSYPQWSCSPHARVSSFNI